MSAPTVTFRDSSFDAGDTQQFLRKIPENEKRLATMVIAGAVRVGGVRIMNGLG
jgi:hypothetical protein